MQNKGGDAILCRLLCDENNFPKISPRSFDMGKRIFVGRWYR